MNSTWFGSFAGLIGGHFISDAVGAFEPASRFRSRRIFLDHGGLFLRWRLHDGSRTACGSHPGVGNVAESIFLLTATSALDRTKKRIDSMYVLYRQPLDPPDNWHKCDEHQPTNRRPSTTTSDVSNHKPSQKLTTSRLSVPTISWILGMPLALTSWDDSHVVNAPR